MKCHAAAALFPLMGGDDFDRLVADIAENGQREPITVMPDGSILDGRNRQRACEYLGIQPITKWYEGDEPIGFVLSLNLHRRHLNESQRAMVAAKLATLRHGGDRKSDQAANLPLETQAKAALLLNVGERSVRAAAKVRAEGAPELVHAVERGAVSVSAAAKQISDAKSVPPSLTSESSPTSAPAQSQTSAPRAPRTVSDAIGTVLAAIKAGEPPETIHKAVRSAQSILAKRRMGTTAEALADGIGALLKAITIMTQGGAP